MQVQLFLRSVKARSKKVEILSAAGVTVALNPAVIGDTIAEINAASGLGPIVLSVR